jgi:hypothetical protein
MSDLSWLNPTPHAIAVYASSPLSPAATQHSLPSRRYPLLGPDLHRLDRTSLRLAHSLHHLVGAGEKRRRNFEALGIAPLTYQRDSCPLPAGERREQEAAAGSPDPPRGAIGFVITLSRNENYYWFRYYPQSKRELLLVSLLPSVETRITRL